MIQVFSKTWFNLHQKKLLVFANTFFGRWILGIEESGEVVRLLPNSYTVKRGNKFVSDFRTHEKFGKRLYYRLKPFWYALHWFDMLFANNYATKLNLGFDTTTVYPNAHPESSSVDGDIISGFYPGSGWYSWTQMRDGNSPSATDNGGIGVLMGFSSHSTTNRFTQMYRSILLFDTSSIGSSHGVTAATFSVYGYSKTQWWNLKSSLVTSAPASNTSLTGSDYGVLGTTLQSDTEITTSSFDTTGYNDYPLNSSGISNVEVAGVTKFGVRDGRYDLPNITPGWTASKTDNQLGYFADQTGTTNDPKLVVVHELATPTVTSGAAATNVFSTTFKLAGEVTDEGLSSVTDRGIVVDTSTGPTISDIKFSSGTGIGAFTAQATGLSPETTYYARAFATNSAGTSYGAEVSFTTDENAALPIMMMDNPVIFS